MDRLFSARRMGMHVVASVREDGDDETCSICEVTIVTGVLHHKLGQMLHHENTGNFNTNLRENAAAGGGQRALWNSE